jgi:hypothetical protein
MISQIRKLIQDKLISGVNIKTINGSSVLGSGNLTVTGTGVSDGDKGDITVSSSGTVWTIDNNAVTNAKINDIDWSKVTGEPTTLSGYGISDTKANFDAACSDGNFLFVGDVTQYTDEMAQDAVGAMVDTSLTYVDSTPLLQRAALTGAITASAGSNTTALGTFTKAQLDTAVSDGVPLFVGDIVGLTDGDKGDITVSSSGTVWNIDAATVGVTELSATGTANNTTFLRGDNTWATPTAANPEGWTTIIKSANQDISTTGLTNVTNFTFSTVAAGMYSVEIDLYYGCASSGTDINIALNVSTGNMTGRIHTMRNQSNATTWTLATMNAVATSGLLVSSGQASDINNPHILKVYAVFNTSANATFNIQHRAGTNGFTVRTMKGAMLKYKKLN